MALFGLGVIMEVAVLGTIVLLAVPALFKLDLQQTGFRFQQVISTTLPSPKANP
jgi:hypothetical protein